MRKIAHSLFALAALLSATAFAAHPTGDYMTWFGSDAAKDVTNSSGSSFFGAWAGEGGEYINYSVYLGALSGYRSYDVNRSIGLGPWALREARNVYGTVAIGTSAGRGIEGCTNCVFIGANAGRGNFGYGSIDIGGVFAYIGDYSPEDTPSYKNIYLCGRTISDIVLECALITSDYSGLYFDGNSASSTKITNGTHDMYWSEETDYDGRLEVDVYGVKKHVAYLSDLDNYVSKDATALHITDEDTGEKYIIKVKSGALKLYKVEETEE